MTEPLRQFYDFSPTRLAEYLVGQGVSLAHVNPLLTNGYRYSEPTPWDTEGLPIRLKSEMAARFRTSLPRVVTQLESEYDASVKFVIEFEDGLQVEMVLMPERGRLTLCISSQVGCNQGCIFCHTGRMGLKRNLSVGEIVSQVVLANRWTRENRPQWQTADCAIGAAKVTNIVFMGMGEPLDNVDNVAAAVETMMHPYALGIAPRKITISTAGHLAGLEAIAKLNLKVGIALSLHATTDAERTRLMPINRKWNIETVLEWFRSYTARTGRTVLIQYTVIAGVNDTPAHADRLLKLLDGINAKLNLIPFNPIDPARFESPDPEKLAAFCKHLYDRGLRFMIRFSKGQDIAAACGQLVRNTSVTH